MTKMTSRMRNTLMPRLSTITTPPRRLRMARPSRESSRLATAIMATTSTPQIR